MDKVNSMLGREPAPQPQVGWIEKRTCEIEDFGSRCFVGTGYLALSAWDLVLAILSGLSVVMTFGSSTMINKFSTKRIGLLEKDAKISYHTFVSALKPTQKQKVIEDLKKHRNDIANYKEPKPQSIPGQVWDYFAGNAPKVVSKAASDAAPVIQSWLGSVPVFGKGLSAANKTYALYAI